ncbi:MAG: hypothetical protein EZS28_043324 [Streblomastix strix]|uniref:DEAD-box helicase OB fold domain-containing protein n=1 Tax=Streblomastix strix TaxID=222440 RepID=A0A5J4TT23_9EUKA|nr:MAG: hypothetical protein EZS28_043324 [Streblomastix strix]
MCGCYEFFKSCFQRDGCYSNFINSRVMINAENVRNQLLRIMKCLQQSTNSPNFISSTYCQSTKKALTAGFFMQVAHFEKIYHYIIAGGGQAVYILLSSCVQTNTTWVMYNELVLMNKHFIRTVTEIVPEWIVELAPQYYHPESFPEGEARTAIDQVIK